MFRSINAEASGIVFNNVITASDSFNILNFHYIYNGGGVGVGDFNQDGLPDLVFAGNQVSSVLYLNEGSLKFKDVSVAASFDVKGWATGVSVVDINADGLDDIYMNIGGFKCQGNCYNQLFINQGVNENGVPVFVEKAQDYGLDDGLYTQQSIFFDFDLDGDLDVYLLHNVIDNRDKNAPSEKHFINVRSRDQLLRNDGTTFKDVSDSMGVTHRGYGLGVAVDDLDLDGWPDIYVANDFLSDDLIYKNNGVKNNKHQGFTEVSKQVLKHTSYNSMGVDVADINQDALPDILALDMLPERQERLKNMMGFMNYNKFLFTLRQGYMPQFVRNTLQVHNGFLKDDWLPYSEVGYLTGLYQTDWSWTPLLADYDNDGDRDVFITNGYGKDITDLDFINYSNQAFASGTESDRREKLFELVQEMESIKLPNYFFENGGDLNFTNRSDEWIEEDRSISNGGVYVDLDADGDLDIVANNINDSAFLLENLTAGESSNNYLKISLKGSGGNINGLGSRVSVWVGGEQQYHYQSPVRGYLSTVDKLIHFGVGKAMEIDSVKVIWASGNVSFLKHVEAGKVVEIEEKKSMIQIENKKSAVAEINFSKADGILKFQHKENQFQDFDAQPLLIHQSSQGGPCLAVADVDGQPGDELFVGGAKGIPSKLLYENESGVYTALILKDSLGEDVDAVFFDADQDGDKDLYVVRGGTEFLEGAPELRDRLYLNDGAGHFMLDEEKLPAVSLVGSCAAPADFDKDGDIDLFIGGSIIPRKYPYSPGSYLLVNNDGNFTATNNKIANDFNRLGMVKDAVWSDYDGDGWLDLFVVGEWMSVTLIKNNKGVLSIEEGALPDWLNGWWNCIKVADVDQDGDDDFLLGNLGFNTRFKASPEQPMVLYKKDYDKNGSPDPLIGQFLLNEKGDKKMYPIHARDDVMKQLVKLKNRYVKYADFGQATMAELLTVSVDTSSFLFIHDLSSMCLLNKGADGFEIMAFPKEAQYAPIQDILIEDFDGDTKPDILLSGNNYSAEKNGGWQDAMNGLMLKGLGDGHFESIPTSKSGFHVPGDGRDVVLLKTKSNKNVIVVGQNAGWSASFYWEQPAF